MESDRIVIPCFIVGLSLLGSYCFNETIKYEIRVGMQLLLLKRKKNPSMIKEFLGYFRLLHARFTKPYYGGQLNHRREGRQNEMN